MSDNPKVNTQPQRALALDALRGIAILMMVFASAIPFGVLPSWMYHAQEPPPLHIANPNLPGITWVDLVFPFFLFAMGAAIPLSLSRKVKQGVKSLKIYQSVISRGLLLAGFAIYFCQINPYSLSTTQDWRSWAIAVLGFAFVFPILARLPESWNKAAKYSLKAIGWIGAVSLMAIVRFPDGTGFSLYKSDIIILVLSNVAVFGSIIWIISRDNWLLRLGFLGFLLAIRLSAHTTGWVHSIWNISPVPWLFQFRFLTYLFIIIPGTIAGDLILNWMNSVNTQSENVSNWSKIRLASIAAVAFFIVIEVVAGMKLRLVLPAFILSLALCSIIWRLTQKPGNASEKFLSSIFKWGTYWLILGFLFDSFEGGIKKDPSTMSYYFVTSGLAILVLITFTIIIDISGKKKYFGLLIRSGQNPMVAYGGLNNIVIPILALTKLNLVLQYLTPTPWLGVLGGAFITYLVALAAAFATKKKIFLRT